MKILFGKEAERYEMYLKDRDKALMVENERLKEEKAEIKKRLNSFCKDRKHDFLVATDEYGETLKTCRKCPMTVKLSREDI